MYIAVFKNFSMAQFYEFNGASLQSYPPKILLIMQNI